MSRKGAVVTLCALLLAACAAGAPEPAQKVLAITRGRALFANKGCGTCHTNQRAPGHESLNVGPDLTLYRNDAAFLQRWLTDPASVRPGTQMPRLGLSDQEIEDLVAFLNEPR